MAIAAQTIQLAFPTKTSAEAAESPQALADRSLEAHGGKKLREMSSLLVSGKVDITVSSFQQAIPASFSTALAGERYLLEINSDVAAFRQAFDGENTYTSPQRGFSIPPLNRMGIALLQKIGTEGYEVSEAPKKDGFRITTPEGYYTDFYLTRKTGLIKSYESAYSVAGRTVSTLVEVKKYEITEGLSIPSRYDQRFEMGSLTVYAAFKADKVLVNTDLPDEMFGGKAN